MAKMSTWNKIGIWAFLIGIIIAVLLGIFSTFLNTTLYNVAIALLVIAGLIVGFLNVKGEETPKFLIAAIALVVVGYMGESAMMALASIPYAGNALSGILTALMLLFIPATVIVALKAVIKLAKN